MTVEKKLAFLHAVMKARYPSEMGKVAKAYGVPPEANPFAVAGELHEHEAEWNSGYNTA